MATACASPQGLVAVADVAGLTVRSYAVKPALATYMTPFFTARLLVSSCTTSESGAAASAIAPGAPLMVAPVDVRAMLMRDVVTRGGATTPAIVAMPESFAT